jgi:hypothetical protein
MRGTIVLASAALVLLTPALAMATADFVYFEQTSNPVCTGCDPFVASLTVDPAQTYALHYKIGYQTYTNQVGVYYTTDGTAPAGSYGTPSGTSQFGQPSYAYTYVDTGGTVDIVADTIPAQPAGTTVKFILSAWYTPGASSGPEVFANSSSSSPCTSSTCCTSSSCAMVFSYTVSTPLPDAGADAASEAGVDAEIEAAADAAAEVGSEAGAPDAGAEAAADAGVDAETDASAEASVDSGGSADASPDAGTDGAVAADTGSMTGQDATMMSEAGGADSSMGGSPDATASVDSSDDASEPNFAIPGNDNGCGCSLPGGPADVAGGALGLYALLALAGRARLRARRRR